MSKEMRAILDSERALGKAEGMQQGRAEEKISLLISLVKEKLLSIAEAAKRLGISESEFARMAKV